MTISHDNSPESADRGYMGDRARGASMGRSNQSGYTDRNGQWVELTVLPNAPPFSLRKVRLDSGGYDQGGAYWGCHSHGSILYYYEGPISDISGYVRAADRDDAKAEVRAIHPNARFFR